MSKLSLYSHPHKPLICLGYIPVDEYTEAFRSTVIEYAYNKGRGTTRKDSMKIYTTKAISASYPPVKKYVPVWAYSEELKL